MVSGLNQQQNRNLQFGAQGAIQPQNAQNIQNNQIPAQNSGQNFGALTIKPDSFENSANDPNFGALDRETLEKGTQKVQKTVDNNPFTQMLKNMFGVDIHNPKKTLISLGLTIATVLPLAKLGSSKFATEKLADAGIAVSDALKKNNAYMNITGKLKGAKDSVVKFLEKSETIKDVFDTFRYRRAKAVNPWAKGTGSGLKRIFSLTAPDTAKTALDKMVDAGDASELARLKCLVSGGEAAQRKLDKLTKKGKNITADKLKELTDVINQGAAARAPLNALQAKIDAPKLESLKKLAGVEEEARKLFASLDGDSVEVSNNLLHSIGKCFGFSDGNKITDHKAMHTILRQLKEGKITGLDGTLNIDVSEFTNIKMNNNTGIQKIVGDWWPVNLIDDIGRKIRGDKWKPFGRGNLGDALIKHSIISGQGTDTMAGKFVQQLALFPAEAISNFGNDKSGLGFFLCGMIMNMYNNVQDAPKEKKVATMADDFMGTIGSLAITTPMACATMYGLATLKNMKSDTLLTKFLLRPIGKFFGAGLDQSWKNVLANPSGSKVKDIFRQVPGRTVGFVGGAMRLLLVMFVFQSIFGKPFKAAVHKVFGKPYDPDQEAALKQQQAQAEAQAQVMKNLNMTEEQMLAKLQAHPEFITALQNDPKTLAAIQENPALLLQLVAALPDNKFSNSTATPSPLLQKQLNNQPASAPAQNVQQQAPVSNPMQQQAQPVQQTTTQAQAAQPVQNDVQNKPETPASKEPVRTYIPSSKPFNYVEGDTNTIKPEEITNSNVQAMLSKADKAEMEAMKILG